MRALVLEDDIHLSRLLKTYLTKHRLIVDCVFDGEQALKKIISNNYDVVILDIGVPNKSGLGVCQEVRAAGLNTPILMLTGRHSIEDRVIGLDAGADDYLAKPFGMRELLARVQALLRRPQQVLPLELKAGDLTMNPIAYTVERAGQPIELMPKEFALLEHMLRNQGVTLTKQELLSSVWGVYSTSSSNRLEVYIRYLRQKIDQDFDYPLIKTVRGIGYKLDVTQNANLSAELVESFR